MRSKLDKETLHDVYINSIYIKAGKKSIYFDTNESLRHGREIQF